MVVDIYRFAPSFAVVGAFRYHDVSVIVGSRLPQTVAVSEDADGSVSHKVEHDSGVARADFAVGASHRHSRFPSATAVGAASRNHIDVGRQVATVIPSLVGSHNQGACVGGADGWNAVEFRSRIAWREKHGAVGDGK